MNQKEIIYFIIIVILILVLDYLVVGSINLDTFSTIDINIHDTYFIIPSLQFILWLAAFVFFCIYGIRMFRRNFKNLTANLIFMIANMCMIILISKISGMLDSFGNTSTPQNNTIAATIIFGIQLFLIAFLAFCGFKTGMNYRKDSRGEP